jgi:hypothetical protein
VQTQPAPLPPRSVVVQLTATSACLETARRGGEISHLFVTNQHDRVADLLVAYSVPRRQCRRDASLEQAHHGRGGCAAGAQGLQ